MKVEIRLFATMKDKVGQSRIEVAVDEPSTVQQLLEATADQYPQLKSSLEVALVSVNKAFADEETIIYSGDEIAMFPPVSGGGGPYPFPTHFAITHTAVDILEIHQKLTQPDVGAIVSFSGYVRGQTARSGLPAETIHLEYEAYEEMAEAKMAQIAVEIWERWPLVKGIAIVQHLGKLEVGDHTTFVACAAGHRDQGVFEAARYGIDRLKEIVPVWKKEVGKDKSVWVEGSYRPTSKDNPS